VLVAGNVAILCAGGAMYQSLLPAPQVMATYDAIFFGMLPESPEPQIDLLALGLDPAYSRYSGTVAWSPGAGVADGALVRSLQENVNPAKIMWFYIMRPARLQEHVRTALISALSLRPEFCGNYDVSADKPPGARSETLSLWSRFHSRCLARIGGFLVCYLFMFVMFGGALLFRLYKYDHARRRWIEFGILIAFCCLVSFVVPAFGDAWDNTKHQFMFNLSLDTFLIFAVAVTINYCLPSLKNQANLPAPPDRL